MSTTFCTLDSTFLRFFDFCHSSFNQKNLNASPFHWRAFAAPPLPFSSTDSFIIKRRYKSSLRMRVPCNGDELVYVTMATTNDSIRCWSRDTNVSRRLISQLCVRSYVIDHFSNDSIRSFECTNKKRVANHASGYGELNVIVSTQYVLISDSSQLIYWLPSAGENFFLRIIEVEVTRN